VVVALSVRVGPPRTKLTCWIGVCGLGGFECRGGVQRQDPTDTRKRNKTKQNEVGVVRARFIFAGA
jgi:hypothetical protein